MNREKYRKIVEEMNRGINKMLNNVFLKEVELPVVSTSVCAFSKAQSF